jgi:hypothetical protein
VTRMTMHVGTTTGIVIRVTDRAGTFAELPAFNITVLNVNDAPVLVCTGGLAAPPVSAGETDPPGFSVASVLAGAGAGDGISDPDAGALEGVAVTAFAALRGGKWQVRLTGAGPWLDAPAVSLAAALLLPPDADLRFVPPASLSGTRTLTVDYRAWDRTTGTAGSVAAATPNGDTTAFSAAACSFTLVVHGQQLAENWWYPSFSWPQLLVDGTATPYTWYHVQVFAAADLSEPYFEANVHGTTMTAAEYFLAAFDGFPGGQWLWRYRGWDPAANRYGAFTPASLAGPPNPDCVLDLDYGPADAPTDLSCTNPQPGLYLLRFLAGNARGYDVRIVRNGDSELRTWRHAFIPGEDADKQLGTAATLGLDNPVQPPPLFIPRDESATLAVNLPQAGVYRLYVRGFNPTDERDGMPAFTEFPAPITVPTKQPALSPPQATGMIPGGNDLIAIPGSASSMPHRLQWDPVPGAQRFVLYLAAANATPLFNFEDVGNATRLDLDLPPGSYTWQVVGLNQEGAVPTAGHWSPAQHFEVVRSLEGSAVVTTPDAAGTRIAAVERISDTRIRIAWAAGGAAPDLIEIRHFCSGARGWTTYAPRALLDVDPVACTGVIELADLARPGTHHVLLRGYVRSASGSYQAGQPRMFAVPRVDTPPRRVTGSRP